MKSAACFCSLVLTLLTTSGWIPRSNGSCALNAAVETVAGAAAQIAISADVGAYCAKVYDTGTLTAPVPFTISISRP